MLAGTGGHRNALYQQILAVCGWKYEVTEVPRSLLPFQEQLPFK